MTVSLRQSCQGFGLEGSLVAEGLTSSIWLGTPDVAMLQGKSYQEMGQQRSPSRHFR